MTTILDWRGLYANGWKGEIVPAAFAHPAKFSRKLIAKIYDHLLAEGLVQPGARVVDPFGGVALGALDAMRCGLDWTGVELEPKFHALGNENIALWNKRYSTMPRWGSARLLLGDSRNLAALVAAAACAVSSPPYAGTGLGYDRNGLLENGEALYRRPYMDGGNDYGATPGQLGNLREGDFNAAISSPPYADGCAHTGGVDLHPDKLEGGEYHGLGYQAAVSSPPYEEARIGEQSGAANVGRGVNYGASDGQLGTMAAGDFAAAVSSPPFMENNVNIGAVGDTPAMRQQIHSSTKRNDSYGTTEGQLGSMAGGDFRAAVASPPFQDNLGNRPSKSLLQGSGGRMGISQKNEDFYGDTDGNLGNDSGDTFWLAARQIVAQTYHVLAPGGVAVFVCKDFVRNKARVPFCDQWRDLCAAVGFEHLYTARAWMVENDGTQLAHDGNHKSLKKERKSFFRRLNEKNGGPRIDYEQVIFMVKGRGEG